MEIYNFSGQVTQQGNINIWTCPIGKIAEIELIHLSLGHTRGFFVVFPSYFSATASIITTVTVNTYKNESIYSVTSSNDIEYGYMVVADGNRPQPGSIETFNAWHAEGEANNGGISSKFRIGPGSVIHVGGGVSTPTHYNFNAYVETLTS